MFSIRKNGRIASDLGPEATDLLLFGLGAITRILPHTQVTDWEQGAYRKTCVAWTSAERKGLKFAVGIKMGEGDDFAVSGILERRRLPSGVASVARTLDQRERDICRRIVEKLTQMLGPETLLEPEFLVALKATFDETVVAEHIRAQHHLELDPAIIFKALRTLAQQTYENKALAFGCVLDASLVQEPDSGGLFPDDYLLSKKYRALSDGYYTAYLVSTHGALLDFIHLDRRRRRLRGRAYFPEWSRDLATECNGSRVGVCLTRHGDILVLDSSSLRFTYRFGQWQYWNHTHLIDILRNAARVQGVPRDVIPKVASVVYRAALDVAFRRTGGLFVLLRNRRDIHEIVHPGDAIGDSRRSSADIGFDRALAAKTIQNTPRAVIAEVASLDGAVVLTNDGKFLAFGAVLEPKRKGRIRGTEGSRTKAAIGASNYGLAVKVSSDGDITVYIAGKKFMSV